jgi:hypothetical protein
MGRGSANVLASGAGGALLFGPRSKRGLGPESVDLVGPVLNRRTEITLDQLIGEYHQGKPKALTQAINAHRALLSDPSPALARLSSAVVEQAITQRYPQLSEDKRGLFAAETSSAIAKLGKRRITTCAADQVFIEGPLFSGPLDDIADDIIRRCINRVNHALAHNRQNRWISDGLLPWFAEHLADQAQQPVSEQLVAEPAGKVFLSLLVGALNRGANPTWALWRITARKDGGLIRRAEKWPSARAHIRVLHEAIGAQLRVVDIDAILSAAHQQTRRELAPAIVAGEDLLSLAERARNNVMRASEQAIVDRVRAAGGSVVESKVVRTDWLLPTVAQQDLLASGARFDADDLAVGLRAYHQLDASDGPSTIAGARQRMSQALEVQLNR